MTEPKKVATFAYNGDHQETRVFGLAFLHGEPVEVTDETAIRKLRNNPDFSEFFDGVEVLDPVAVDRPKRKYTRKAE